MIEQLQGQAAGIKATQTQLKALYGHCCGTLPDLSDEPPQNLIDLLIKMLKGIYRTRHMPAVIDTGVTEYFAQEFYKAVVEGYGASLLTVDFTTPDYLVLRHLEENVYQFAAAKNYQQLKAVTQALVDDEGKLRSFSEFKRASFEVLNEQVTSYMEAEYNLAVAGGQMAATWTRIQENKETLPLLKYITVGDDRVRPEHAELEGVIRPVDDDFWDMYYPPNGWNCRCDVIQLSDGTETPLDDIVTPANMPALFKTNLAKHGLVFPPNHPYYIGIPDKVMEQAKKLLHKRG